MNDVNFFLFCDAAAVTQENKMVAHGIFENLSAQQFPVVHPALAVVFRIEGPDVLNGAELNFRLKNVMAEKNIVDVKFPLNMQVPNNIFQGVLNVVAIQIDNAGVYQGELLLNGKQIGSSKLLVMQIK